MNIGLRIDVDTTRGTRLGVPSLNRALARHGVAATWFFSVGPDNMGRHLFRLLRPAFLWKMIRTRAASLYGWDVLFRGTLWPGAVIGERLGDVIRDTAKAGHEVGLHAWDHHAWQAHIDVMSAEAVRGALSRGYDMLTRILGRPPECSAVPGWKCNDLVLRAKCAFPFVYNSDCRGESTFRPVVAGEPLDQPQIPVTLPTYDEVVGRAGIGDDEYNEYILSLADPDGLNVLTIHAEVEGIARAGMFEDFLKLARSRDVSLCTLGALRNRFPPRVGAAVVRGELPGREGWLAFQGPAEPLGAGESA